MLGALILAFIIVIGFPVATAMGGGVLSAVIGGLLNAQNKADHEGSELVESNY